MLSGRAKRVLVYTAAILIAPVPVMPFEKGEREFAWAVMVCGIILALSSFYVARGEWRLKNRSLLGYKLLASSIITFVFGVLLLAGSILYLGR